MVVYVTDKCDVCPFWNDECGCRLPLPVNRCPVWQDEEERFNNAINGLITERTELTKQVSDFIRNLNNAVQKLCDIKRPTTYDEMYELQSYIDHVRFMAFGDPDD